jgi:hypothetical protein
MRALGLAIAAILIAAAPARAQVFTVNTTLDTTPGQSQCTAVACSLRAAVEAAAEGDTVQVPAGTFTLQFGTLTVPSAASGAGITIAGAGAASTIISGNNSSRVLTIGGEGRAFVSRVTLRDGVAAGQSGGNVLVGNTSWLVLDHARVTAGTAARGGGIAGSAAQLIQINNSAVDTNVATGTAVGTDGGGGLYIDGQSSATQMFIRDSTIAFNRASADGGGINVRSIVSATTQLSAVTLARNTSTAGAGGGLYQPSPNSQSQVRGSILAANSPSNCGGSPPAINGGGNVESGAECGFGGHQNTDPQLATALADQFVLPIAATSPAVDIVSPCITSTDQRDVVRPQGGACDAGAYEVIPAPPPPAPTATPTPVPTATPVAGKSVAGTVAEGKVLVKTPGGKFVALDPTKPIPLGSTIDTKNGAILLTAQQRTNGKPQTAKFFDGIFKITQTKTTTDLTLTEALAKCPARHTAHAAAKKKKKKPKSRKLWGDGSGSFRTRGQYSAATVRGTRWLVQDSCSGTLTKVRKGAVTVRDLVKRRTIIVRAGKKYLARPPR